MYLIPIGLDDHPFPGPNCWQTYALSSDAEGEQCDFLGQLMDLDSADVESFFAWLLHFQKLCTSLPKRPMKELIPDSDKFHSVGTATLKTASGSSKKETIWQFTHSRIRVMFCYTGEGRILLLGRVLIKKSQRTKKSDVQLVEKAMQTYLDAQNSGALKILKGE